MLAEKQYCVLRCVAGLVLVFGCSCCLALNFLLSLGSGLYCGSASEEPFSAGIGASAPPRSAGFDSVTVCNRKSSAVFTCSQNYFAIGSWEKRLSSISVEINGSVY